MINNLHIPIMANEVRAIIEYKKYSEKISKLTPEDVIAKINNAANLLLNSIRQRALIEINAI